MPTINDLEVWNIPRRVRTTASLKAYALSATLALCALPAPTCTGTHPTPTPRAAPAPSQPPARPPHDPTVEIGPIDMTSPLPMKPIPPPEPEPEADGVDALYHGCLLQCGKTVRVDRKMAMDECLKEHTPCEQSPVWETHD